jgi:hypothetical protein
VTRFHELEVVDGWSATTFALVALANITAAIPGWAAERVAPAAIMRNE